MTKQETEIELNYLTSIIKKESGEYIAEYEDHSDLSIIPLKENIFANAK